MSNESKTNSGSPWRRERYHIKCCHGCVPPERRVGCHGTCKKYSDEKAEYEKKNG